MWQFAAAQDHQHTPRNDVEAALVQAVHGTTTGQAFEAVFLVSPVYIRIEPETFAALSEGQATGATFNPADMKVFAVEPQPGLQAIVVYLSEEGFNRDQPGRHWLRLPGRDLLAFASANGMGVFVTDAAGADPDSDEGGFHAVTWTVQDSRTVLSRNQPGS